LESELGANELQGQNIWKTKASLTYCNRCKRAFEEKSRVCPRCDKKDEMGKIAPIPEKYQEQAYQRALREARARL
jgi:anaerobic ribonucleoside-triphosphate reductase